jgi:hypothetical protein
MWLVLLLTTVCVCVGGGGAYGEDINRFTKSAFAAYMDTHKQKDWCSVFILMVHISHNCWKVRMGVLLIWQQLTAVCGTDAAVGIAFSTFAIIFTQRIQLSHYRPGQAVRASGG